MNFVTGRHDSSRECGVLTNPVNIRFWLYKIIVKKWWQKRQYMSYEECPKIYRNILDYSVRNLVCQRYCQFWSVFNQINLGLDYDLNKSTEHCISIQCPKVSLTNSSQSLELKTSPMFWSHSVFTGKNRSYISLLPKWNRNRHPDFFLRISLFRANVRFIQSCGRWCKCQGLHLNCQLFTFCLRG